MRGALMRDALQQMVNQGVQVSDADARHAYDLRDEKIKLAYIQIPYQDFTAKISPTPKQVEDYYNSHKDEFQEPERIKIDYIHYDPAILGEKVTPSDKDIQDYYNSNLKKLYTHPDEVHARHILIEVPAGATAEQKAKAKAKAEDIMKQLRKGADFAKLAKQYSRGSFDAQRWRRSRQLRARSDDQTIRGSGLLDEARRAAAGGNQVRLS